VLAALRLRRQRRLLELVDGAAIVVLLQRQPFCAAGSPELAAALEAGLALIPPDCHLLLVSPGKPDARLRSTKAIKAVAKEQSFALPAIWDGGGQVELVARTAA
jgi:DNA polymerase-3 subunit delta